jgi:hypothetical protein
MCFYLSIPYACHDGDTDGIRGAGCEGPLARKTTLVLPGHDQPVFLGHPSILPIRRCQRFFDQIKKGVDESQACTLREESRERGERVRCPLRCPGCIARFERLTKRALLYGTTDSDTVRRAKGGLRICEKNWDRNLLQALKSQGQPDVSPVSIVRIWPWLVRRPFNLEWYEEGMSQLILGPHDTIRGYGEYGRH